MTTSYANTALGHNANSNATAAAAPGWRVMTRRSFAVRGTSEVAMFRAHCIRWKCEYKLHYPNLFDEYLIGFEKDPKRRAKCFDDEIKRLVDLHFKDLREDWRYRHSILGKPWPFPLRQLAVEDELAEINYIMGVFDGSIIERGFCLPVKSDLVKLQQGPAMYREMERRRRQLQWRLVRRHFRRRAILFYWQEQTQRALFAPGGAGRKADRTAFELEFGDFESPTTEIFDLFW